MLTPEPIAICGIGLRLPGGIDTPTSLYNFLINRQDARCRPDKPRYNSQNHHYTASGISRSLPTEEGYWLTHNDVTKFDPSFFSMNPKELSKLDPQQRLLLQVVWEALESAAEPHWQGQKIGCYVGSFGDDWREIHAVETQDDGMYRLTGYMDFVQANRISHVFDLRGPSMTVRTACSAAGLAVHLACQAIRAGECDSAVVAGSNLMLSPSFTKLMAEQSVLSPDASCKTFDASANGYARAEAINCLFIKKLDSAIRDGNPIRAVIRGSATNSDGKTLGLTTPSAQAQQQLIYDAYRHAGISETDMWRTAMIECHGTGTTVGDTIEACTIGTVFSEKGMLIGSVKPNLGHSEGASAITSIVKAVLSLDTRTIIPNIKFESPSISIPFESAGLKVPTEPIPWPKDRAERIGVNSFGIGGTNVHIILDSAATVSHLVAARGSGIVDTPPPSPPLRREIATLLLFSAAHEESLKKLVQNYKALVHARSVQLQDLAHTLIHRRSHLAYRTFAVVTDECGDLAFNIPPGLGFRSNSRSEDIAFIFTDQGAQWPRMGFHLMKTSKEFVQDIREMDATLKHLPKEHQPCWEIGRELMKSEISSRLGQAEFSQPVCTALQVALVRHLQRYHVAPKAVVGHSSGEIAAAYAAGVLTMKEAIIVAYYRGYTAKKLKKSGAMAAVGLGREQVTPFLVSGVSIACENSNSSVTLSGDVAALKSVCDAVKSSKPEALVRVLNVDKAYHSHHMRTISEEYQALIEPYLDPKPPTVTFYSSVSGQTLQCASNFDAKYWQRNLESPVLFRQAVTRLLHTSSATLHLEIGPHSALAGPLKQIYSENSVSPHYVSIQKRGSNSVTAFLFAVGELHCRGFPVNFPILDGAHSLTDLPPYPWNLSKSYWPESRSTKAWQFPTHPPHELLGSRVLGTSDTETSWRCLLSDDKVTWMKDHCVGSDIVFPAAGYIAMALEAARQLTADSSLTIRKTSIMNALVIIPGRPFELLTSVRQERLTDIAVSNWWELIVQSCSSAGTWTTHCTCRIRGGATSDSTFVSPVDAASLLQSIQPSLWYKAMSRVGYNYGPQFRGMRTIRASTTSPAVEVGVSNGQVTESLHPITIDQILQSLVVASHSGESRLLDKLYLPTHIDDLYIRGGPAPESLLIQTTKTGEKALFQGDSVGWTPGDSGDRPVIIMKGLRFSPVDVITSTENKPSTSRLTHVEWEPDIDLFDSAKLIESACAPEFPETHELLEELFNLCGFLALQEVEAIDMSSQEAHLRKHYHWLKKHIGISKNDWTTDAEDDIKHRINQIDMKLENTPASAVATLIKRCYINAHSLFTCQMSPLETFLKDNALHELYDWMNKLFTYKSLLRLLSHKRGRHLKILEIGAGTGGLTARILALLTDCLPDSKVLGKYVFTDVSAGFFSAAKARFEAIPEGFLDFRVLDISRDPDDQGFGREQYDIIVASNVLHATPNLTKTLQHVKGLLKPEGRLLMHELCCETKWINFIMGYLPGWWLGEGDGRPNEPYISPKQWEERLFAAGFLKPDVYYDAGPQHRLNATIIARPAPSATCAVTGRRDITLLCDEESHPVVFDLRNILKAQGYSVTCTKVSAEYNQTCSAFISVIDLCREEGYFHNMTEEKLDAFKDMLRTLQENDNGLLWITRSCQINPVDPTCAPVLGVARTARAEMGLSFSTLEVDSVNSDALHSVARVLRKTLLQHYLPRSSQHGDMEFSVSSGQVYIPRYKWLPMTGALQDTAPSSPFKILQIPRRGDLQSLRWISRRLSEDIASDHVQVRVQAAGLNFKDVVTAMGLIDPSSYEGIGCEASGIVTSTGSSVTNLRVGDRVMLFAPHAACFSTDVQAPAQLCVRIPDDLSYHDAAGMPCIFVTVLRALWEKAGLRAGQSVLIHSAAGGVGIAAMQMARWIGATIYATVGSDEKAEFISQKWNIPRENIFSSRSTSFVNGIKQATGGRGVDVVLNSLSGELLHASWDCVAPHGTFVELGKRDTLADGKLTMAAFDENRSFIGIEMAKLAVQDPSIIARLLRQCVKLYLEGHITPVRPMKVVSCQEVEDAFRYLYKGTHIGKVVVNLGDSEVAALSVTQPTPTPRFCDKSTYILVGGMRGLGVSIARWMASHGARALTFLSRSAGAGKGDQSLIAELCGRGCEVEAVPCDITNETELRAVISKVSSSKRIRGVLNLAMVLSDVALLDITLSHWKAATSPKIRGTWNLHRVLPADLDFFVVFGSTSGIHGYPGQANYAAANTFLDTFAQYRRRLGLPCSVLDLGGVEDIGYVSRTQEVEDAMRKAGVKLVSETDMLQGLQVAISRSLPDKTPSKAGAEFDGQVVIGLDCDVPLDDASNRVVWKQDPRMFHYPEHPVLPVTDGKGAESSGLTEFLAHLQSNPSETDTSASVAYLAQKVALRVFGFLMKDIDDDGVDTSVSPATLGVDSLMTIEIRNWWKHTLGGDISVLQLTSAQSFDQLGQLAAKQLMGKTATEKC